MLRPSCARSTRRALLLTTAIAAALPLAGAAPAAGSLAVTSEAPAGTSADPAVAGRDLTAMGIAFSPATGTLTGAVRLAGTPDPDRQGQVGLYLGSKAAGGCTAYPALGFLFLTAGGDPRWARLDGPDAVITGRAELKGSGQAVQTLTAGDPRLRGLRPDCAVVSVSEPGNPQVVYDAIGPLDLVAYAEPTVRFRDVPDPFATGRSREIKVVIGNTGDAPTERMQVRLRAGRGVTVRPATVRIPPVAVGARRTVKVRVTPTRKAAPRTALTALMGRGATQVRAEAQIRHRRTPGPRRSGRGDDGRPSQTCTRWIPDLSGESGGYLGLVPC